MDVFIIRWRNCGWVGQLWDFSLCVSRDGEGGTTCGIFRGREWWNEGFVMDLVSGVSRQFKGYFIILANI